MQADFVAEVIDSLNGIHILLDTSGYAEQSSFIKVVSKVQHVYYDLKLIDSEQHLYWTGKNNAVILQNILILDEMEVDYTIRVPLIPSVTDTVQNLKLIADFVKQLKNPNEINLLSYNYLAGGKYKSVEMEYTIKSNPSPTINMLPGHIFSNLRIPVRLLTTGENGSHPKTSFFR